MTVTVPQGGSTYLNKDNPALTDIVVGVGWDTKTDDPSVQYSLDASLFLLAATGKVRGDEDFIFYNQKQDGDGSISLICEDDSGFVGRDRTRFLISLARLPFDITRLAFCLTIYDAEARNQSFGQIEWIRIRILDQRTSEELLHYDLSNDVSSETAIILGEVYRHANAWKFRAVGQGYAGGLEKLATRFGVTLQDAGPLPESSSVSTNPLTTEELSLIRRRGRRAQQDLILDQASQIKQKMQGLLAQITNALNNQQNESSTRLILDRILQDVLGYPIECIKTEQRIQGRKADYVLCVDSKDVLVIESKRVGLPLKETQIFQATSYGAYSGIQWAVLTNLTEWQVYRITTKEKIEADLVIKVNLNSGFDDESAYHLALISRWGIVRPQHLERLWLKRSALSKESVIAAILNDEVISKIRSVISRETGCQVTNREVLGVIEKEVLELE